MKSNKEKTLEITYTSLKKAIEIASNFSKSSNKLLDESFIDDLSNVLYRQWYTKSNAKKTFELLPHEDWAQVFRTAHTGTYRWEKDWRVLKVSSSGRIIAIHKGEERMLYPGDYIAFTRAGILPALGSTIDVVARRDTIESQPGFWIAYSSTWSQISGSLVRIYWNINPEGAIYLAKEISAKIPDDIPYSFKLPIEATGYKRSDVAVLYFESNQFDGLKTTLKSIYSTMIPFLYPEVPEFTKILELGVGVSEDPSIELESFGMNRCRLIAEGYISAVKLYPNNRLKIETSVQNYLIKSGIDLSSPHLNKGSNNDYEW